VDEQRRCDLCGVLIAPHAHYVVRIEVFADPTVPALNVEGLGVAGADETYEKLIEQMKHMSEEELQDQVHRHFYFTLCPTCQPEFLVNPLGRPRRRRVSEN
jgi:hypothetical protein